MQTAWASISSTWGEYDFSSLSFPVPHSSVGSFALRNNMSINVYGVDDDNELIYPL